MAAPVETLASPPDSQHPEATVADRSVRTHFKRHRTPHTILKAYRGALKRHEQDKEDGEPEKLVAEKDGDGEDKEDEEVPVEEPAVEGKQQEEPEEATVAETTEDGHAPAEPPAAAAAMEEAYIAAADLEDASSTSSGDMSSSEEDQADGHGDGIHAASDEGEAQDQLGELREPTGGFSLPGLIADQLLQNRKASEERMQLLRHRASLSTSPEVSQARERFRHMAQRIGSFQCVGGSGWMT